jgi:UDPglucose 6-dehydrogenase/GDP-mannose 6-dehydrogenase
MKISVIGTGYVGLVSGVCLAEIGHSVYCVDIDQTKIDRINNGDSPIYERGLDDLLQKNTGQCLHESQLVERLYQGESDLYESGFDRLLKKNIGQCLFATTELRKAVLETDLSFIAVGTPFDGKQIDLTYVKEVTRQIGEALKEKTSYHVVVVKSTVVPGTTDSVVIPTLQNASRKKAGQDFGVGMNPEFLREGNAVEDFMSPDRIVLGAIDAKTLEYMAALYAPFTKTELVCTNPKTAEMIKYTSNALLATMISFSNEIGNLCQRTGGIDVKDVMRGVHLDKRLSPILEDGERIIPSFTTYIEAGCGFGGSCFPKDVNALVSYGKEIGTPMSLLDAVIQINNKQPEQVIALLDKHFETLNALRISVLGLAFKPETDDMRESPAIPVVHTLAARGAKLTAYDPIARKTADVLFKGLDVKFASTLQKAIADAQAIVLLTHWSEFDQLAEMLSQRDHPPLLVDGRRMLDKNDFPRYEGIGLG